MKPIDGALRIDNELRIVESEESLERTEAELNEPDPEDPEKSMAHLLGEVTQDDSA